MREAILKVIKDFSKDGSGNEVKQNIPPIVFGFLADEIVKEINRINGLPKNGFKVCTSSQANIQIAVEPIKVNIDLEDLFAKFLLFLNKEEK